MLLKNKSARLITVNGSLNDKGERTEKYLIKPGKNPAVEVPDELCGSAFVQSLIDNEDLIAVAGSPVKPELQGSPVKPDLKPRVNDDADSGDSLYADFDKAQLVAQCEARDIEVKSRDTATQLIAKLEEADK